MINPRLFKAIVKLSLSFPFFPSSSFMQFRRTDDRQFIEEFAFEFVAKRHVERKRRFYGTFSFSFTLCLLEGKLSEPNCDFNSGRVANNQSDRATLCDPRHAISRAKEKKGRRVEGEEERGKQWRKVARLMPTQLPSYVRWCSGNELERLN